MTDEHALVRASEAADLDRVAARAWTNIFWLAAVGFLLLAWALFEAATPVAAMAASLAAMLPFKAAVMRYLQARARRRAWAPPLRRLLEDPSERHGDFNTLKVRDWLMFDLIAGDRRGRPPGGDRLAGHGAGGRPRGSVTAGARTGFTGLKVRLDTADVDATVEFYRDTMGLAVVERWAEPDDVGVIFGLDEGLSGPAFVEFALASSPANGNASVQLRVADLARFLARIEGRWAYEGPVDRPWGSVYAYLTDPNGVQVIVYDGSV